MSAWTAFAGMVLKLVRVRQWIKNVFVLAPLVFSGAFTHSPAVLAAFGGLLAFCFLSSGVYILNDIADARKDALHPVKKNRPVASGKISARLAGFLAAVFITAGMGLAFTLGPLTAFWAGLYLVLHGLYNFFGKRIVLVDVIAIALGFCLRVLAGAAAIGVVPSVWLQLCVFLLALFLGFSKRRHEIVLLGETASGHRGVLRHYTVSLLDQLIMVSATLAIVFYGLYTITPEVVGRTGGMAISYSLVFVIYGMFRYLYLVHVRRGGDDAAEALIKDFQLMAAVGCWAVYNAGIILLAKR